MNTEPLRRAAQILEGRGELRWSPEYPVALRAAADYVDKHEIDKHEAAALAQLNHEAWRGEIHRLDPERPSPLEQAVEDQRTAKLSAALNAVPGGANSADPWAHRSQRMKCATCMWWVRKAPPQSTGPMEPSLGSRAADELMRDTIENPLGRCRRHAPRPEGGGWPAVYASDWCGDHKLDEAKA